MLFEVLKAGSVLRNSGVNSCWLIILEGDPKAFSFCRSCIMARLALALRLLGWSSMSLSRAILAEV